ncbi:MAG: ABC transporter substrate-binding protein [Planctomycetota bacterium]|nr:ABC transporter substrate-binding protein [Planctomycetota bacterium]
MFQARIPFWCWLCLLGTVAILPATLPASAWSQEKEDEEESEESKDLLDRRPFDRIYLDKFNKDAILEVEELNSTKSLNPASNPPQEQLQFQFLWDSVNWYQAPWKNIVRVETYPEILLKEIRKQLDDKSPSRREENLARAFRFLDRVLNDPKYRNDSRVQEYLREYLYEDAFYSFNSGNLREAWTALDVLFFTARDFRPTADSPTVVQMLSDLIGRRMGAMVKARNYRAAESLMESTRNKYGSTQEAVIDKWQSQIIADAEQEKAKAVRFFREKNARKVHDSVRNMLNIYPRISGGREMFRRVIEEFPLVFVGVTDIAEIGNPASLLSWAERRKGRLYYRSVVEYYRQGQDGGIYRFPHGNIEVAGDLKSMQFVFRSDNDELAVPDMDAYQLRKRLLDLADDRKPDYSPVWAELIKSTFAQNPKILTVNLKQPHVRPEALLQVNHEVFNVKAPPKEDAYYIQIPSKDTGDLYTPNPMYPVLSERKLPQIVEMVFKNATEQTDALLRGDIDVIDRVFPADISRLKKNPEIDVQPYTIPTIHVLIPNLRKKHMESTIFRTALLYGINRPKILFSGLLGGSAPNGFRIISGPVPYGITETDPIGYAYNPRIEPLVADARLGLVQAVVSDDQIKKLLKRQGKEKEFKPLKDLVFKLCYPANDFARSACASIKLDLEVIGVKTELVEMKPGQTYPEDGDFDLLYSEITMQEPFLDVRKILASEGLAQTDNDAINQAIRFLDTAKSWRDARPRLHELHSLCFHNTIVMPLWQVVEHYAYRKNVKGVGKKINSLYKNVVDWKITDQIEGKGN